MLTTKQAAERIHRTPDALCKAAQRSEIRATKFGRAWMFDEVDVDAYAEAPKDRGGRPKKESTMDTNTTVEQAAREMARGTDRTFYVYGSKITSISKSGNGYFIGTETGAVTAQGDQFLTADKPRQN